MKFNFLPREAVQLDYWHAWLDGFIACEVAALVVLVSYCLAHTF